MNLSDVTVLDLTWLLPGPYGSMLLSDLGADVIKIEEPTTGDLARGREPTVKSTGNGAMYEAVNRNKRSVAIDLKSDAGREAFFELARDADVVFEQFRPGVVDRLGVGYEAVRAVNDDIVYCSLSGYGQDGPLRTQTGHNTNYVAMAGLLAETKSQDGSIPALPSYPIADMAGGMFAAFAILAALRDRDTGNGGEYLDISIADVVLSMATGQEWRVSMRDDLSESERSMDNRDEPNVGVYETRDGEYVTISCRDEKFWTQLLSEIGREDLESHHLASGAEGEFAVAELQAEFGKRTRDEWVELISDEVPFAPVRHLDECFTDEHFCSRGMVPSVADNTTGVNDFTEANEASVDDESNNTDESAVADGSDDADIGNPLPYIGFPAKSSKGINDVHAPAPDLGEHTVEVLEAVLSDEEMQALRDANVI